MTDHAPHLREIARVQSERDRAQRELAESQAREAVLLKALSWFRAWPEFVVAPEFVDAAQTDVERALANPSPRRHSPPVRAGRASGCGGGRNRGIPPRVCSMRSTSRPRRAEGRLDMSDTTGTYEPQPSKCAIVGCSRDQWIEAQHVQRTPYQAESIGFDRPVSWTIHAFCREHCTEAAKGGA